MAVNINLMTELAAHAVLDRLRLSHVDPRRYQAPGRGLVGVGPVHGPEAGIPALEQPNDTIAPPDLGPGTSVDVEA